MAIQGTQTSEFKLTMVVIIVGIVMEAFAGILTQLQTANPTSTWVGVAMSVVGAVMILLKALGYTKSRTALKLGELAAGAAANGDTETTININPGATGTGPNP